MEYLCVKPGPCRGDWTTCPFFLLISKCPFVCNSCVIAWFFPIHQRRLFYLETYAFNLLYAPFGRWAPAPLDFSARPWDKRSITSIDDGQQVVCVFQKTFLWQWENCICFLDFKAKLCNFLYLITKREKFCCKTHIALLSFQKYPIHPTYSML